MGPDLLSGSRNSQVAWRVVCLVTMKADRGDLIDRVRRVYGRVADSPDGKHPFRVGRRFAERVGYPEEWLAAIPPASVESFAGVSCVPCFAQFAAGARVLDLGCGAGLDALLVSARAGRVVGVDFSEQMVGRAKQSATAMAVTNVEFKVGSAEAIPAETGSFDVAIVNGIFNLNLARAAILSELARVLVPGGLVFAAELVLKGPLPPEIEPSRDDWFA